MQSTVPIACKNTSIYIRHLNKTSVRFSCDVRIEMFSFQDHFESTPTHCNDSVTEGIKPSICGTTMNGIKWYEPHKITVDTLADQSSRQSYICSINLQAKSSTDDLWFNYNLPEVLVSSQYY